MNKTTPIQFGLNINQASPSNARKDEVLSFAIRLKNDVRIDSEREDLLVKTCPRDEDGEPLFTAEVIGELIAIRNDYAFVRGDEGLIKWLMQTYQISFIEAIGVCRGPESEVGEARRIYLDCNFIHGLMDCFRRDLLKIEQNHGWIEGSQVSWSFVDYGETKACEPS